MKIPTFYYKCNVCNLGIDTKEMIYGIHFHKITKTKPEDEQPYSVLKKEPEKTDDHICIDCLKKIQEKDPEIGLNRALNKSQVELLVGKKL